MSHSHYWFLKILTLSECPVPVSTGQVVLLLFIQLRRYCKHCANTKPLLIELIRSFVISDFVADCPSPQLPAMTTALRWKTNVAGS